MNPDAPLAASSSPDPAPHPSLVRRVFIGQNGLRSGWRLLIYLAIVAAVLGAIAKFLKVGNSAGRTSLSPIETGGGAAALFLISLLAAWIMSRIEGRSLGQYGLPWVQAFHKDFWVGLLWGIGTTSATVLVIFLLHGVTVSGGPVHGGKLLLSAAAWALAFLFVGFNEEFGFRGYLQFTLTTGIGFWPAAFVIAGLFGLAHMGNSGENMFGELSVVLFGLLFCLFLRRRGTLWWAVGFHMGYDFAETFLWGEPDSGLLPTHNWFSSSFSGPKWLTGGTVGPEASVITPIMLVIVGLLFSLCYREVKYSTTLKQVGRLG